MTPQRLFLRKIIYLMAMAVLLMVLAWLGQPATVRVGEEKGSGGGVLAQMRSKHNFSEAQLGDIDPASETIKLATLGLRGVAVQVLWEKSNTYKMKKDWANLKATLEQIIRLEPHFSKVWYFQGWNLSYNVSVEFDDYRERYRWVIKGIELLKKGIRYNRNDPILYRDVAWFISQKIGRADESVQFRKLFKEDEDFHREDEFGPARPLEQRDNWLVGKDWYLRAENVIHQIDPVDPTKGLKKVSPVVFFANKPMCQMNYSDNLAKDGIFGEKARLAWIEAGDDWEQFGHVPLPGSDPDMYVHLNDKEKLLAEHKALLDELEKTQPGLRESTTRRGGQNRIKDDHSGPPRPELPGYGARDGGGPEHADLGAIRRFPVVAGEELRLDRFRRQWKDSLHSPFILGGNGSDAAGGFRAEPTKDGEIGLHACARGGVGAGDGEGVKAATGRQ